MTNLLPECHNNQSTWSENDQESFDRVRQFILELARSFGLQAHKALSLTENLTWFTVGGSPHFNFDDSHSRNSYYLPILVVTGLVPSTDWRNWYQLDLKDHIHNSLRANYDKFAHNTPCLER